MDKNSPEKSIWIRSIRNALTHLGGAATEAQILELFKTRFTPYSKTAKTPRRSLNMFLNQKMKNEVDRQGNLWILKTIQPQCLFPDDVDEAEVILTEGAKRQILVNAFERNTIARRKCIDFYGCTCFICSFSFEKHYGDIGKNFIHVHHLKQLSEIGYNYVIDPIRDLRPVCPNCHAMLHQRKPCYSIEQLKEFVSQLAP